MYISGGESPNIQTWHIHWYCFCVTELVGSVCKQWLPLLMGHHEVCHKFKHLTIVKITKLCWETFFFLPVKTPLTVGVARIFLCVAATNCTKGQLLRALTWHCNNIWLLCENTTFLGKIVQETSQESFLLLLLLLMLKIILTLFKSSRIRVYGL